VKVGESSEIQLFNQLLNQFIYTKIHRLQLQVTVITTDTVLSDSESGESSESQLFNRLTK
jgi:thioester reductase-like protein